MRSQKYWKHAEKLILLFFSSLLVFFIHACSQGDPQDPPVLKWYVFDEPSGAFKLAAEHCTKEADGAYRISLALLPGDANQQREQLVRRLAARDRDIDIIGMDVIWTAEFAEAGWIHPWTGIDEIRITRNRLETSIKSASYNGTIWAAPFTTNTQLLWYRTDRVTHVPETWYEMITLAESLGKVGTIQAQGERYEGLTVFFISLLNSAGGRVLDKSGEHVSLEHEPTYQALSIMSKLANSSAADPSLSTTRENQARLAFESGNSTFMVNYTFIWPSVNNNAPVVASNMGWSRWPRVHENHPSRVTIGGINLGIGAYSRYPSLAFKAATCISSEENQRIAAQLGGLPPTIETLYFDSTVRDKFPFADVLLDTLKNAVQRPQTPLYNDISLAISRTLHPMNEIQPDRDIERLRKAVERALKSEGLI